MNLEKVCVRCGKIMTDICAVRNGRDYCLLCNEILNWTEIEK